MKVRARPGAGAWVGLGLELGLGLGRNALAQERPRQAALAQAWPRCAGQAALARALG